MCSFSRALNKYDGFVTGFSYANAEKCYQSRLSKSSRVVSDVSSVFKCHLLDVVWS